MLQDRDDYDYDYDDDDDEQGDLFLSSVQQACRSQRVLMYKRHLCETFSKLIPIS